MAPLPPRKTLTLAVVALLAVVVAACGGDSETASDDELGTEVSSERPINFTGAGSVKLGGILSLPEMIAEGGVPAVVFVPMPGAGDREGPIAPTGIPDRIFADLSDELVEAGVATFRYDRRGVGLSPIDDGSVLDLDDMVADAVAAVELVVQRSEVADDEVMVFGYGEGGLLAMQAVADGASVARLALLSTPGRPLVDVVASSLAAEVGATSAEEFRSLVGDLLAGEPLPPLDAMSNEHRILLPADQEGLLRQLYSVAPLELANQVSVPTLVVASSQAAGAAIADGNSLVAALGGPSELLTTDVAGPTLTLLESRPELDPNNPASGIIHEHDAEGMTLLEGGRDDEAVSALVAWLAQLT